MKTFVALDTDLVQPSTSRRKFELPWALRQATRGFPFMVHLNGFAMVALK
jgi:hypothetical protein